MPVSKYFGGHGDEVMKNMTKEYGSKKGKQVFYATANKRKKSPYKHKGIDTGPSADFFKKGGK